MELSKTIHFYSTFSLLFTDFTQKFYVQTSQALKYMHHVLSSMHIEGEFKYIRP